jgi:hypothetical protein
MLCDRKCFAAAVASLLLMIFLPARGRAEAPSRAQNANASTRESKIEQEATPCALEPEMALVPHRLMIAEGSCEVRELGKMGMGFCRIGSQEKQACQAEEDRALLGLAAMGKQGETIRRARAQVLEILEGENVCTAWFRELELDPRETFRSVRFVVDENGPRYVFGVRLGSQGELFKHPWVASTVENSGRGATIWLNANGAFFNGSSELVEKELSGGPSRLAGTRVLRVDWYMGNTPEAQITALLHELGHIVRRIPEDNDSLDGESGRNTVEVLRHCRPEIKAAAGKSRRGER